MMTRNDKLIKLDKLIGTIAAVDPGSMTRTVLLAYLKGVTHGIADEPLSLILSNVEKMNR